jgi:ABC-type cobalamin transport system ATPase subunit
VPVSASPNVIFALENVSLHSRVKDVHLHINKGECWHFLGPNGAGKSSLLGLLSGIETASRGLVAFNNKNIAEQSLTQLAQFRCCLQQQQQTQFDIPLWQLLQFYTQSSEVPAIIDEYLHILPLMQKPLGSLSGGQQQRFHIARNLCQIWPAVLAGNGVLLFDEPISHLDVNYQAHTMALLAKISALGNTIIMTSHDINISQQYASHIGLLQHQALIFQGVSQDVLTLENLGFVFDHKFAQINAAEQGRKYLVSQPNQSA